MALPGLAQLLEGFLTGLAEMIQPIVSNVLDDRDRWLGHRKDYLDNAGQLHALLFRALIQAMEEDCSGAKVALADRRSKSQFVVNFDVPTAQKDSDQTSSSGSPGLNMRVEYLHVYLPFFMVARSLATADLLPLGQEPSQPAQAYQWRWASSEEQGHQRPTLYRMHGANDECQWQTLRLKKSATLQLGLPAMPEAYQQARREWLLANQLSQQELYLFATPRSNVQLAAAVDLPIPLPNCLDCDKLGEGLPDGWPHSVQAYCSLGEIFEEANRAIARREEVAVWLFRGSHQLLPGLAGPVGSAVKKWVFAGCWAEDFSYKVPSERKKRPATHGSSTLPTQARIWVRRWA